MRRFIQPIGLALILSMGLVLTGCSRSPSEEELAQLDQLRRERDQLQTNVRDSQRDRDNLQRQLDEKNGRLRQCQDDQEAVRKATGGQ